MNFHGKDIKIFTCNSNIPVAQQIAACLGIPVGKSDVSSFSDGEIAVSQTYPTTKQMSEWTGVNLDLMPAK